MILDLQIHTNVNKAKERLNYLIHKGAKVEIIEKRKNRSLPQNNYLHLLLGKVSVYTGYSLNFVKENFYKKECNSDLFVKDVEGKLGIVEELKSTRELDTLQTTVSIERFRNWSADVLELYLPEPSDLNHLEEIKNELEQYNTQIYL